MFTVPHKEVLNTADLSVPDIFLFVIIIVLALFSTVQGLFYFLELLLRNYFLIKLL